MNRRLLIKSSAATLFLGAIPAVAQATTAGDEADVLVIGGGLAGLNAATQLKKAGQSVILLEARDHLGGRAHTVKLPTGLSVDLGAQYVADSHTRLHGLIKAAGIKLIPSERTGDVMWPGGPGGTFQRQSGDYVPLSFFSMLDAALAERSVGRASVDFDIATQGALDRISAADFLRSQTWFSETSSFLNALSGDDFCVSLDEVSGFEMLEQLHSLGGLDAVNGTDKDYLQGGVGGVVDYLAKGLATEIVLNAPVRAISEVPDGLRVETDSRAYRARRVVLAIPPQLIPTIAITPALPAHRAQVLQGFKPGSVIKTVLQFDNPWWRAQGLSGRFVDPGARYSWVVDSSPAEGGTGVLTGFTTANAALDPVVAGATEEARIADFIGWLRQVTGQPLPDPIAARSMNWSAEAYSRGGFSSHRPIGGWVDAPDLFEPYRNLHFAGTETANLHRSYMEGALQSGERAAAEILRSLAS